MSVKEQLKESAKIEKEKLKAMSWKDKVWYISEYYKFHILGIMTVVILVVSIGTTIYKNNFDTALSCVIINNKSAANADTAYLEQGFHEYLGLGEKERIIVDNSLYVTYGNNASEYAFAAMTKITALVASKDLDVMIADEENIDHYAQLGGLVNLEEALPADLYELVEDHIYYAKGEDGVAYPCGVSLAETGFEQNTNMVIQPPLFSIMSSTIRLDNSIALLRYFFES